MATGRTKSNKLFAEVTADLTPEQIEGWYFLATESQTSEKFSIRIRFSPVFVYTCIGISVVNVLHFQLLQNH